MVDVNAIQRFPELGYGPQDFNWKKVSWQSKTELVWEIAMKF